MKLLGQRLMARKFDRKVAELHVSISVLNGDTALGIPVTEAVGYNRCARGKGKLGHQRVCATEPFIITVTEVEKTKKIPWPKFLSCA